MHKRLVLSFQVSAQFESCNLRDKHIFSRMKHPYPKAHTLAPYRHQDAQIQLNIAIRCIGRLID